MTNFITVWDQTMFLQMKARPVGINIVQVYDTAAEKKDNEIYDTKYKRSSEKTQIDYYR